MEEAKKDDWKWLRLFGYATTFVISFCTIYFTFIKETKANEDVNNQTVVQNLQYQIDRLEEQQDKQHEKIEALTVLYRDCGELNTKLKIENEKLKIQKYFKTSYNNQKPYAEWTKSLNFIVTDVNDKCLEWFFEPLNLGREQVVGFDDYANWTKEDADRFREMDKLVLRSGKEVNYNQEVKVGGRVLKLHVIRYPVYKNSKIVELKGSAFLIN